MVEKKANFYAALNVTKLITNKGGDFMCQDNNEITEYRKIHQNL